MSSRDEASRSSSKLWAKVLDVHGRVPYIRRLPPAAIAIVALLVTVNLLVWTVCGIVLSFHPALVSTAVLSYTLGLRHALDAE